MHQMDVHFDNKCLFSDARDQNKVYNKILINKIFASQNLY